MEIVVNTRRRVFRPEVGVTLEDRLVLSTVVPSSTATIERALASGPTSDPVMIVTDAGSSQSKVLIHGGASLHGQLTFSAHVASLGAPNADGIGIVTLKVDYHNESHRPITSATLEEKLGPNLTYLPGQIHTPPDSVLTVSTSPSGTQVLNLKLPGGIAPGVEGYLEFQAEYRVF
jgi:hypothetical protein